MSIDLVKLSEETAPYAKELRRHFHRHPEPTSKEFETIRYICAQLDTLGIPYVSIPDGGVLAEIRGSAETPEDSPAPHVLLRADCDALSMDENPENSSGPRCCCSETPGVAHMCGHDSHMAMLLGAAKILAGLDPKLIKGTVYLLFERGEEGGNCIYYVMKYIQTKKISIDSCFALHVDPEIPAGRYRIQDGPSHGGNVNFEIELIGQGGHGSRPDLSNNPLDCFMAVMNQLKDVRLKYISPKDLITYNIGSVQCGHKRNIVPERLEFKGTARFFNPEAGRIFKEKLDAIIKTCAALYDCRPVYHVFSGPSLSVVNNKEAAELAAEAVSELFGKECIIPGQPELGSESFSTLTAYYPGVMIRVGVRNEEKGITAALHNPGFDLDEDALKYGIAVHAAYALKYLEKKPDIKFKPFSGDADELLRYTSRPVPPRYDQGA